MRAKDMAVTSMARVSAMDGEKGENFGVSEIERERLRNVVV